MAKISGQITSLKLNALESFARDLSKVAGKYDKEMERKITVATNLVWRVAHQKRPMMNKSVEKKGRLTKMGNISYRRVSDPNAALGVPVDTGRLQSSIKKEVKRIGVGKFQGEVYPDESIAPYAKDMEYGTSKVHARPFMRPAKDALNNQLKSIFTIKGVLK